MPLTKHNNELPASATATSGHQQQYPPAEMLPPHGATQNARYDDRTSAGGMGGRAGYGHDGGYEQAGYNDQHRTGMNDNRHHDPGFQQSSQYDDPYAQNRHGGAAIPATATSPTNHGGKPSSMSGKIQHAVGTMVGSESLKMKGLQKEQEAKEYKVQSAELQQAELLEREALARRERAVAHGAHPDNRHLGAGGPAAGGVGRSGAGSGY